MNVVSFNGSRLADFQLRQKVQTPNRRAIRYLNGYTAIRPSQAGGNFYLNIYLGVEHLNYKWFTLRTTFLFYQISFRLLYIHRIFQYEYDYPESIVHH